MTPSGLPLRDFISQSLIDILKGVEDARSETGGDESLIGACARIVGVDETPEGKQETIAVAKERISQTVEFDVAVTVSNTKTTSIEATGEVKGKFIMVLSADVNVGVETTRDSAQSTVSRIKFKVPMIFPGRDFDALTTRTVFKNPRPEIRPVMC